MSTFGADCTDEVSLRNTNLWYPSFHFTYLSSPCLNRKLSMAIHSTISQPPKPLDAPRQCDDGFWTLPSRKNEQKQQFWPPKSSTGWWIGKPQICSTTGTSYWCMAGGVILLRRLFSHRWIEIPKVADFLAPFNSGRDYLRETCSIDCAWQRYIMPTSFNIIERHRTFDKFTQTKPGSIQYTQKPEPWNSQQGFSPAWWPLVSRRMELILGVKMDIQAKWPSTFVDQISELISHLILFR